MIISSDDRQYGRLNRPAVCDYNPLLQKNPEEMLQFTINSGLGGFHQLNLMDSRIFQPSAGATGGSIPTTEVYRMLGEVNRSLNEIKKDLSDIKQDKEVTHGKMESIQFDMDKLAEDFEQLDLQNRVQKDQIQLLNGNLIRFKHYMADMQKRMLAMEGRSMKSNLLISGLPEKKEENCVKTCQDFISQDLKINSADIEIRRAHRMGKFKPGNTRPMVMKLQDPGQKGQLFQNTKNLKGTNKYLNDQLPDETNEEKRRQRQIVAANNKLPPGQKQTMKIEKGKLLIGDEKTGRREYRADIKPPTISDVMNLSAQELDNITEVELYSTQTVSEQGSFFKGYGAIISNRTSIRKLYLHLKIKHSGATHISMIYHMAGLDKAYDEGFCDDGEHGLGRRILKKLTDEDRKQLVVFIVRNYGGQNLGKTRFEIAQKLVDQIVAEFGAGTVPTSKLSLAQNRDTTRTVRPKQFHTVKSRRHSKQINQGASPTLRASTSRGDKRPGSPLWPTPRNALSEYLNQNYLHGDSEIEAGINSCPTSATSADGRTEDEEDYLSTLEAEADGRAIPEDWSSEKPRRMGRQAGNTHGKLKYVGHNNPLREF